MSGHQALATHAPILLCRQAAESRGYLGRQCMPAPPAVTAPDSPGYPGETRPADRAGLSLPPQLPIVPSAKVQVQVERPQAKPRTNDLEMRRATAILAQRGRLPGGRNWSGLHKPKIVKWVQDQSESGGQNSPDKPLPTDNAAYGITVRQEQNVPSRPLVTSCTPSRPSAAKAGATAVRFRLVRELVAR